MDDDRGYLNAIGRQQTAMVIAAAEVVEAERMEQARTAQARANKAIAEAENEVRIVKAQLSARSQAEEARAGVAAQIAQAQAQQELAEQEIQLSIKRQRAEIVVVAEAEREAAEARAKGEAARVTEAGNAEVEVLRLKLAVWKEAGADAERLFLLQMLPEVLREVVRPVDNLRIDKITVVDSGGSGGGVPAVMRQIAGATPALFESLKTSTGVDIAALLSGTSSPSNDAPRIAAPAPPTSAS